MFSQYVTRAGARMLVKKAVKDDGKTGNQLTDQLIATEGTAAIARQLVETTFKRLQWRQASRSAYERILINELAKRTTQESAEIFAVETENGWIQEHEQGYPSSRLDPDARPKPHGTSGHVCWLQTKVIRKSGRYFWSPEIPHIVIQVASYLGAAGAGGIIGNRADAIATNIASECSPL
jgi:hypothetical protein